MRKGSIIGWLIVRREAKKKGSDFVSPRRRSWKEYSGAGNKGFTSSRNVPFAYQVNYGQVDQFEVCCIVSCQVNLLLFQSVVSATTTRVQLFNFLYFSSEKMVVWRIFLWREEISRVEIIIYSAVLITYRVEQDVGRLEVAVDDGFLVAVKEGEALGGAHRDVETRCPRQNGRELCNTHASTRKIMISCYISEPTWYKHD